jgi:filamentous hemagglutinin family protein
MKNSKYHHPGFEETSNFKSQAWQYRHKRGWSHTWIALIALGCALGTFPTSANPLGGTVVRGSASFANSGSQMTIHASDGSFINWQSFNIGVGQTTTFIQPTANSVVWNNINDPNPSQILGNLNANGYVVLQNSAGFYIGGQATITAHGFIMTTAPIRAPDLFSGGPWSFKAPPPTAKIVNYGQINATKGGSIFLLAHDIENNGAITAPKGQVGLYAGKQVLVSTRPDGRGLSAQVTLPEGSVDNNGQIVADAGTIALHAQVVNQGGLLQANSVRQTKGGIELVASEAVNLGANSVVEARGDSVGISPGGSVLIKSDQAFSDQPGSSIDISGGAQGGNGGQAEISAGTLPPIQTTIQGRAASGFKGGNLLIDPYDLLIDSAFVSSLTPILSDGLYRISLQADDNIEISTFWTLRDSGGAALLTLSAGNSIILDDGSGIRAVLFDANGNPTTQNGWSVSLIAGTQVPAGSKPDPNNANFINGLSRLDGIYLDGNSSIMTMNGNISLLAANEVIINPGPNDPLGTGDVGSGNRWNGIRTARGGNIDVTALNGDVNTGGNFNGYLFGQSAAPFYKVSPNVGGISTIAGGNVTITAGGNVTSYLPTSDDYNDAQYDGGTGAFGPQAGNVTITAGGNVSGHYVLANGLGTIKAQNGNISDFALSLVKGSWAVSAHGDITLQEVRNPNGELNDAAGSVDSDPGYHRFDYDPHASVSLTAGGSVEISGSGALNIPPSAGSVMPLLFAPSLHVSAGGNFVLDTDVTLFPSAYGDLTIKTGGNFQSYQDPKNPQDVNVFKLIMSDSAAVQWNPIPPDGTFGSFLPNDHAATPPELNNPNPVEISVGGSLNNVNLYTTKETEITVTHDMLNSGLIGENLHASDVTSISVGGKISYPPIYTFIKLSQPIVGADPLNPSAWASIFSLLVDPVATANYQVPANATLDQIKAAADSLKLVLNPGANPNPGFIYDPATLQLGYAFQMSAYVRGVLEGKLETIKLDKFGNPMVQNGHFVTTPLTFVPTSALETLYKNSRDSVLDAQHLSPGFQVGGPGRFVVNANSIDLGSSSGIISWGRGNGAIETGGRDYSSLAGVTGSGAALSVNVAGDLSMLTSTIASIDGGDVNVNSGGEIDLSLGQLAFVPVNAGNAAFGIYTSGHSDVNVIAQNDVNIGSARIATFNGGNLFVESLDGNVNAGNGANTTLVVPVVYKDPSTGDLVSGSIQNPKPYGSGILAISPTGQWQAQGSSGLPGDITVETPNGDITSTLGGIQQFALNGNISGGPEITLNAGTPPFPDGSGGHTGNVDLGAGGVIGGTVNITAQGDIKGLIVSRQNATINAAHDATITLLSGGTANVSASGSISGTVVGIAGVNAGGGAAITAALLGQNVSVGGAAAQSTLGSSAASTSTSQAAAQQATSSVQQQVAGTDQSEQDKKKKGKGPVLTRRVGRVTVILPKS